MSSLERDIWEEHASEAAFLWTLRDRAVHDWAYNRLSVAELDERVEAHVDGLRLAEKAGLSTSLAAVEETSAAGEAFVAMLLAVERSDLRAIAKVLDLAGQDVAASRGIVSAMGWAPAEKAHAILPGLLSGRCPPALNYLGIAACAVRREDPGAPFGYALFSKDERLLCRTLRAAGELGRKDLLDVIRPQLDSGSEVCRFWAAWSLALLGDRDAHALGVLWSIAETGGPFADQACDMAARKGSIAESLSRISMLAEMEGRVRTALAGAAALGEPTLVPWLLDCMAQPETARRAALAFTMITGLDLEENKLASKAPEGFSTGPNDDADDEDVEMDPDESLPWPEAAVLRGWWSREGGLFQRGTRYLLGKPLDGTWVEVVQHAGRQPARKAAAIESVLAGHEKVLAEVRGSSPAATRRP